MDWTGGSGCFLICRNSEHPKSFSGLKMKNQIIFGLSAALLTCAATIAMGQSSAFASTSDGLAAVYAGYSDSSRDNKMYLFDGKKYVRWSSASHTMDSGYPKQIHGPWPGVPGDLDAAIYAGYSSGSFNNKLYFFKGNQYWRWNIETDAMSDGYPKLIKNGWPGIPNNLDAAVYGGRSDTHRNNKLYFFKGSQYWRWDIELDELEPGYPKTIQDLWPGLPNNLDMAVYSGFSDSNRANKLYFFKDNKYWRWDNKADRLDENYPRSVAKNWPGIRQARAVPKSALAQDLRSANNKYCELTQTLECPRDQAKYGDHYDYGYWGGGSWCGSKATAGYWVWKNPNWYVWKSNKGCAAVTPSTETYAFDTNWGLLTVHSDDGVTFKGTYGKKGGRVYGVYDDGDRTFRGFWDKPKAKKKCSRKKRGSIYWGKIEFQLSSNEDSFTGVWGYCDDQPSRDWSGTERLPSQVFTQCNTEDSCKAAAVAQGLQLGGAGYAFSSGSSVYSRGCYAYESGTYGGRAYFGSGGSQQQMEAVLRAPKYRLCGPNRKIKQ